jgi:NAD(P)H dehydrogenase (quinone)
MAQILVLFYSRTGHVASLAEAIAEGVEREGSEAKLRTVPSLSPSYAEATGDHFESEDGYLFATKDDLRDCDGLALGSPSRFGTMAAPLKGFLETTSDLWLSGAMIDKPACVFASASSLHGGHEAVLHSMMTPLLHHGMVIMGCPYSDPGLATTEGGGTPYGPTHLDADTLRPHEREMAVRLGQRLAKWSQHD